MSHDIETLLWLLLSDLIPLEGVGRASPEFHCVSDALLTDVEEVQGNPPVKCLAVRST